MTEIEFAEIVSDRNGFCLNYLRDGLILSCEDCPAYRVRKERGLSDCGILWSCNAHIKAEWFKNFLKETKESKMKSEKIKELRAKLKNITDEQLETIAYIIYDQIVDPEQHIIDAFNEFNDKLGYTDEECLFAGKVNIHSEFPKSFYAGFKAAEKMYKK